MVLLDLIGADNPRFYNSFKETNDLFERMQLIGMCVVFQRCMLNEISEILNYNQNYNQNFYLRA